MGGTGHTGRRTIQKGRRSVWNTVSITTTTVWDGRFQLPKRSYRHLCRNRLSFGFGDSVKMWYHMVNDLMSEVWYSMGQDLSVIPYTHIEHNVQFDIFLA